MKLNAMCLLCLVGISTGCANVRLFHPSSPIEESEANLRPVPAGCAKKTLRRSKNAAEKVAETVITLPFLVIGLPATIAMLIAYDQAEREGGMLP